MREMKSAKRTKTVHKVNEKPGGCQVTGAKERRELSGRWDRGLLQESIV